MVYIRILKLQQKNAKTNKINGPKKANDFILFAGIIA